MDSGIYYNIPAKEAPYSKKCSTCGAIKEIDYFYRDRLHGDGRCSSCKVCSDKRHHIWTSNNRERVYAIQKRWVTNHKEQANAMSNKWSRENVESARKAWSKYSQKRRSTPTGRLSQSISRLMNHSLHGRKGYQKWESLVGYDLTQLKHHLEKQFTDGMTWANYGDWHVDHIIPISVFNFETPDDFDFKRCWSLKNLQPMWARENIIKGNRLSKPFQPSLSIGG